MLTPQHSRIKRSGPARVQRANKPLKPTNSPYSRASPSKLRVKVGCLSFDNVDVVLCEVSFFNLSRLIRGNPPGSSGR